MSIFTVTADVSDVVYFIHPSGFRMRLLSLFFLASKQQSEKSDGGGTIGTVKRFKRIWKDYGYLSDEVREITNTSKHLSQDQREELRLQALRGIAIETISAEFEIGTSAEKVRFTFHSGNTERVVHQRVDW